MCIKIYKPEGGPLCVNSECCDRAAPVFFDTLKCRSETAHETK